MLFFSIIIIMVFGIISTGILGGIISGKLIGSNDIESDYYIEISGGLFQFFKSINIPITKNLDDKYRLMYNEDSENFVNGDYYEIIDKKENKPVPNSHHFNKFKYRNDNHTFN